jgi:osmotically-inducible protein OsmY
MLVRSTRWVIAALVALSALAVGCARPGRASQLPHGQVLLTEDRSVVHAFDTDIESRLLDRLELDHFLRDRDIRIHVVDGTVSVTGEVWTPLEKARVSELVRGIAGVIDVENELDIHPPE